MMSYKVLFYFALVVFAIQIAVINAGDQGVGPYESLSDQTASPGKLAKIKAIPGAAFDRVKDTGVKGIKKVGGAASNLSEGVKNAAHNAPSMRNGLKKLSFRKSSK